MALYIFSLALFFGLNSPEEYEVPGWYQRSRELAFLSELGYNEAMELFAGVAESVDALDSKSKIALLEKLLRELKRKIQ